MNPLDTNLADPRTKQVQFRDCPVSGRMILQVNEGVPVREVLSEVADLLDGLWTILRSLAEPDLEGDACGRQLNALRLIAETASCMVHACSRAMEQEEAGHEHS